MWRASCDETKRCVHVHVYFYWNERGGHEKTRKYRLIGSLFANMLQRPYVNGFARIRFPIARNVSETLILYVLSIRARSAKYHMHIYAACIPVVWNLRPLSLSLLAQQSVRGTKILTGVRLHRTHPQTRYFMPLTVGKRSVASLGSHFTRECNVFSFGVPLRVSPLLP